MITDKNDFKNVFDYFDYCLRFSVFPEPHEEPGKINPEKIAFYDEDEHRFKPKKDTVENTIVHELEQLDVLIHYKDKFFFWNDYFWEELNKLLILKQVKKIYSCFSLKYTSKKGNEIIEQLKSVTNVNDINTEKKIPTSNGYFNIYTQQFEDIEKYDYFTYCFETKDEDCPEFKKFIVEFIPDEIDRHKLLAFLAYCLVPDISAQKGMIIVGDENTGKTVFTDLLNATFGTGKFCANVHLQTFTTDIHATAALDTKLLNIGDDLPEIAMKDVSKIKSIITDEYLPVRPLYRPHTTIKNICRHIYTCNKIPTVYSADRAFYRRWIIIKTCKAIPNDKIDPGLKDKLIVEIPAIINYLVDNLDIEYLQKLRETDANIKKWRELGDFVQRFIALKTEEDSDNKERSDVLYEKYKQFCRVYKEPPINFVWFQRRVANMGYIVEREYDDFQKQRISYTYGIKLLT